VGAGERVAQTCFLGLRPFSFARGFTALIRMGAYQIVTTRTWPTVLDVPPPTQPKKPQT
jgi:hypothetical protein